MTDELVYLAITLFQFISSTNMKILFLSNEHRSLLFLELKQAYDID